RDEQLKTMKEETELQRQKLQEEMVEYKEQSKQHSVTIVALEDRLLEAKQQQKALEEENAELMAKMEGSQGLELQIPKGWAMGCPETHKAVVCLGELSEEQKVKLEQNLSQVKRQERELNLLREKLSQMSSLMEEKDRALKAAAEELRYVPPCPDALQKLLCRFQQLMAFRSLPGSQRHNQLGCFFQEPLLDLADLGAKCRGLRHEETIRRQREGLAELRERVKMLEKRQSSAATTKGSEPLVVLPKDLPEKIVQKKGLEKELSSVSGTQLKASKVPGHVPNGCSHGAADGAASSERADATDFDEKMYLDAIGALGRLLKVKELLGMQPLKHLPQEERDKARLQRWKALELLCDRIRNLKTRLERKEEMLKDYEASVEQLRLNEVSLRRCQEEMSKLEDEASREAEEKALLKEALERTQLQLNQEKRLLRAAKLHKV
ncbi:FHAD1 protein, partial [Halcyon senegalensis]|nr:FHAD1 protein [Halcyon senegalensis]